MSSDAFTSTLDYPSTFPQLETLSFLLNRLPKKPPHSPITIARCKRFWRHMNSILLEFGYLQHRDHEESLLLDTDDQFH
ncbi:hypothetical protein BCR42DRAFT_427427, partial [Absidia repens]